MPTMKISSGVEMNYIIPSSPDPSALSIDTARPTVVMLHPWFFDSHFFAPQYRDSRLAKGYNLVAIDHHYHGKTKVVLDDQPYDWQKVRIRSLIFPLKTLILVISGGQRHI